MIKIFCCASSCSLKSILFGAILGLVGFSPLSAAAQASEVEAIVKLPPLRSLSDKVMGVARKVQPGQGTEMIPLLFLGGLGYPSYPGISSTDPVGLVLLKGSPGNPYPFVLMVKMEGAEQIRQVIQQQFGWHLQDRDGWTLVAKDPAVFNQITSVSAMSSLLGELNDYDIQARILRSQEKAGQLTNLLQGTLVAWLMEVFPDSDPDTTVASAQYLEVLESVLSNLEWSELGINLTPDTLSLAYGVKASEDTPEHAFLSAPSGGKVDLARLIPTDADLLFQSSFDENAFIAYASSLYQRIHQQAPQSHQIQMEETKGDIVKILKSYNGKSAGAIRMDGEDVQVISINGGTFTETVYEEQLAFSFQLSNSILSNIGMTTKDNTPLISYHLEKQKAENISKPIYKTTTRTRIPTLSPEMDTMDQDGETDVSGSGNIYQENVNWSVVFPEMIVNTTELETLLALIQRIESGQSASPSVASSLPGKPGHALEAQLDIVRPFTAEMKAMLGDNASTELIGLLDTFASRPARPLFSSFKNGQGSGHFQIDVPVDTLAALIQFQQAFNEEMMRQMIPADADDTAGN